MKMLERIAYFRPDIETGLLECYTKFTIIFWRLYYAHSSMKAIGVVEGGADTVLDVCIAGAEFCKPIRMQRYLCGSGCTAGVFFVQVLSEKGKSWYTVLKRI